MGSRLQSYALPDVYGGVGPDFPGTKLPDNVAKRTDNWTLSKEGLVFSKGWQLFTSQQLTTGATPDVALEIIGYDEFFRNDGTSQLMCFTTRRAYYFDDTNTDLWIPITPVEHADTIVDADSTAGTATLNVAITTGYSANDRIIINEGGPRSEEKIISVVNAGVSFTLTSNLGFTHTLVQADSVRRLEHRSRVNVDSNAGATTLSVDNTAGYTVGEMILVGRGTARAEYLIIGGITAGTAFTSLTRPSWAPSGTGLQYTHTAAQNDTVIRVADLQYTVAADDVSTTIAEDSFYYCSIAHAVMKWTGTTNFASKLGGLKTGDSVEGLGALTTDYKARYIFFFESFLVLANVEENGTAIPQKIRWSRFGNYTSWVNNVDGSGQAGAFLFFGPSFIQNMFQLKRELFFYREREIEAMTYIGPPDIMAFRRAETGTGLIGPDALVDLGDTHIFMGPDNVWEYNGINLVAIGDVIKNDYFSRLNPFQRSNIKMFLVEETDDVWLTFSEDGTNSHDYAYIYNIILGKWSGPRDLDASAFGYFTESVGVTWDTATGTWDSSALIWDTLLLSANSPLNLMGNASGYTFELENGVTKNGTLMTATYDSKITDCGQPEITKRLQRVKVGMREEGAVNADVYVGLATNSGDDITFYGPYTLSLGSDGVPFVYVDLTARYFQIRIVTTTTSNIRDVELFFIPRVFR